MGWFVLAGLLLIAANVRMVAGWRGVAVAGIALLPYVLLKRPAPVLWLLFGVGASLLPRLHWLLGTAGLAVLTALGLALQSGTTWPDPLWWILALISAWWFMVALREKQTPVIILNGFGIAGLICRQAAVAQGFWLAANAALLTVSIRGSWQKRRDL